MIETAFNTTGTVVFAIIYGYEATVKDEILREKKSYMVKVGKQDTSGNVSCLPTLTMKDETDRILSLLLKCL